MAYTTIDDPGLFFNTKLYTGNGSTQTITGVGFQPDFTWIKDRDALEAHTLQDAVRGAGERLYSSSTAEESNSAISITSWNSDGFALGAGGEVNTNTDNFVSWNWKMGTTTGIAGSADITPSAYSFNQTTGMSVIKYTGSAGAIRTVLHGLGSAPDMIIIKQLTGGTNGWIVGGNNIVSNWGGVLVLNNNSGIFTNPYFGGAVPNATTFSISNTSEVNTSGTYVAYCMRSIQGFSKFGTYTGNGNVNGTFVYTGFKPAFVMAKQNSGAANWIITDNKRDPYNVASKELYPNNTNIEGTDADYYVDFLSNGLKWRGAGAATNAAATYTYAAFAANPFVNSGAVPNNAN